MIDALTIHGLSQVVTAAVASVVPIVTFLVIRYQRSGRIEPTKTSEIWTEIKAIRKDVDSIRVEVAALKKRR